ncbi:glycosyltransferase [Planctomicrobium sp. SH661]|uniref:glycosyltransferase n=1 Tax=Planctomicrobium sp. SH661 TaxID=3448124 RepID=UPI003F5BBE7A
MIKVLIVIPTLDQSGAEKQFGLLACGLPPSEFDVRVVALTRGGPYEALLREHQIPYTILHKRWRLDPSTILKLRREIRDFQPDVLLSCLFSANSSTRLATLGMAKPPVTIISERCVDSWKSRWQLWLDQRLQPRTNRLIANSKSVGEFYEGLGFPQDRISVIPNGVETPPLPTVSREEFCRQWKLPEDSQLIVFVGRLAPQKRLKSLIWAIQVLRQADDRAYLCLVGDGPQRGELELYARDVEALPHVRFLGHRSDASSLLHHADVFWLGSEFEGMSNSLMEAMACGKPVVVSDIPPNRELVHHEREGFVVNLGDSAGFSQYTARLLQDQDLATRMGQAGRSRMETEFSMDRMVQQYADLIRREAGKQ